jgi:hypothetical protein
LLQIKATIVNRSCNGKRETEGIQCYISPRHEKDVPIWKTRGKYRKEMKRGYSKILYNQRNKDETIVSVIKRLFGEHISSRLILMQNRELTFRCITYNLHRMLNLIIIKWILQSRIIYLFIYIIVFEII